MLYAATNTRAAHLNKENRVKMKCMNMYNSSLNMIEITDHDHDTDSSYVSDMETDWGQWEDSSMDLGSVEGVASLSTEAKRKAASKTCDLGFGVYKLTQKTQNRQWVELKLYSTSTNPGSMIRNARSGLKTGGEFRVGTVAEDLFFKVIVATGQWGQSPIFLFYNTPDEYERHFHGIVDKINPKIKTAWEEKQIHASALYQKSQQRKKRDDPQGVIIVK